MTHILARSRSAALIRDYVALTKPRVISLLLLTTLASMFITPAGLPPFSLVVWTLIGGYLMAGGANAHNMAFDCDIDRMMARTAKRPVAEGRISQRHAYAFSAVLAFASIAVLVVFVNTLTAGLALLGYGLYTVVYTRLLKRTTHLNVVIGGVAGSVPPLIGWTAASGELSWVAVWLFVILTLWQPPHFWALAILKKADYAAARVPMLPVVKGEAETVRQIWIYTWLTAASTIVLVPLGAMGAIYLVATLALNARFIADVRTLRAACTRETAVRVYVYSLAYLALLFVAMVIDRVAHLILT